MRAVHPGGGHEDVRVAPPEPGAEDDRDPGLELHRGAGPAGGGEEHARLGGQFGKNVQISRKTLDGIRRLDGIDGDDDRGGGVVGIGRPLGGSRRFERAVLALPANVAGNFDFFGEWVLRRALRAHLAVPSVVPGGFHPASIIHRASDGAQGVSEPPDPSRAVLEHFPRASRRPLGVPRGARQRVERIGDGVCGRHLDDELGEVLVAEDDLVPLPHGVAHVRRARSPVDGRAVGASEVGDEQLAGLRVGFESRVRGADGAEREDDVARGRLAADDHGVAGAVGEANAALREAAGDARGGGEVVRRAVARGREAVRREGGGAGIARSSREATGRGE